MDPSNPIQKTQGQSTPQEVGLGNRLASFGSVVKAVGTAALAGARIIGLQATEVITGKVSEKKEDARDELDSSLNTIFHGLEQVVSKTKIDLPISETDSRLVRLAQTLDLEVSSMDRQEALRNLRARSWTRSSDDLQLRPSSLSSASKPASLESRVKKT